MNTHKLQALLEQVRSETLTEAAKLPRPGERFEADGQKFQIVRTYPTQADAKGPLSKDLYRLITRGGAAAIGKQLKGIQDKGHYLICFNPHGDLDGHPVWMKPMQAKRAFKYEGVELEGGTLDEAFKVPSSIKGGPRVTSPQQITKHVKDTLMDAMPGRGIKFLGWGVVLGNQGPTLVGFYEENGKVLDITISDWK